MVQEKIHRIMSKIEKIYRDKEIKGSKSSYRVTTEGAVLRSLRPLMLEEKLIIYPVAMKMTLAGQIAFAEGTYEVFDCEDNTSIRIAAIGSGYDQSDKMAGKAMTYCGKYGLLKLFMIETTDDDPDLHHSDMNLDIENSRVKNKAANVTTKGALVDYLNRLVSTGKIQQGPSVSLMARVQAMPVDDLQQIKEAAAYLSGFDV